jgi:hypothetical protein
VLAERGGTILFFAVPPPGTNVTIPVAIIGAAMSVCRNAKLKPTAKASMLVAMDKVNRVLVPKRVSFLSASLFLESQIILNKRTWRSFKKISRPFKPN